MNPHPYLFRIYDKTGKCFYASNQGNLFTLELKPVQVILSPRYDIARFLRLIF